MWNPLVKPNLSDFMTNIRRDVFNTLDVFENEKNIAVQSVGVQLKQ